LTATGCRTSTAAREDNAEVRLIAFDLLVLGDDVRQQPLHERKYLLAKLLAQSGDSIQLNPYMAGEIGPAMFEHACKLELEGVKVKNPASPAMRRVEW
jgi:bifunctional non-homologous end joining protein LigD